MSTEGTRNTEEMIEDVSSDERYLSAYNHIRRILIDEYDLSDDVADTAIMDSFLRSVFDKDPEMASHTSNEDYAKEIYELYLAAQNSGSDESADESSAVEKYPYFTPKQDEVLDYRYASKVASKIIYGTLIVAVIVLFIGMLILMTRLDSFETKVENRFTTTEDIITEVVEPEESSDPVGQLTINPADYSPIITSDDIITLCSQFCTTEEMMYVRRGFNTHSYTMEIDADALLLTYKIENDDVKMRIYYHEYGTYFSLAMLNVKGVDIVK